MGESQDENKHGHEVDESPLDFEATGQEKQPAAAGEEGLDDMERDLEQAERTDLEMEAGRLRDALLRTRAEMDNLQKRAEREIEKSRRYAVEGLLRDLVPVIDSLDQGLESQTAEQAELGEGLSLTRKLLVDTLTRYGLTVLDPVGERFDPQWHEAMSMQPSAEHDADTVINVLQKGYRLHDRLVRPARVIVARSAQD